MPRDINKMRRKDISIVVPTATSSFSCFIYLYLRRIATPVWKWLLPAFGHDFGRRFRRVVFIQSFLLEHTRARAHQRHPLPTNSHSLMSRRPANCSSRSWQKICVDVVFAIAFACICTRTNEQKVDISQKTPWPILMYKVRPKSSWFLTRTHKKKKRKFFALICILRRKSMSIILLLTKRQRRIWFGRWTSTFLNFLIYNFFSLFHFEWILSILFQQINCTLVNSWARLFRLPFQFLFTFSQ